MAALADPESESGKWNYQDDMLATNMMLVSIDEEGSSMKNRNHQTNGSMGSMASSRCSSGGSLQGWGTTASRKSYKRDLSSLASLEDHGATTSASASSSTSAQQQHSMSSKESPRSTLMNATAATNAACGESSSNNDADSWGFFVDSAF